MNERILVQDDEEPILEIMCSMLTASGYECLQATSPKKAWAILKSGEGVAVVICGFLESSEDGFFERTIKTFPDVPIVVASACHDSSIFVGVLREGAYDWLLKPFEREQLLAVVRRALEYRRLKLENRALREKLAKEQVYAEDKTIIEERREKLKELNGAATNTFGYIDLLQNGEAEDTIDCLGKAHKSAERAMKIAQAVFFDAIGLLPSDVRRLALSRKERTRRGDKSKGGS